MATNTKVRGTTAGKLVSDKVEFSENLTKFFHTGRQHACRHLQAIVHPPADVAPPAAVQSGDKSIQLARCDRHFLMHDRIIRAVNFAGAQGLKWFDNHKIKMRQRRQTLDALAAT